MMRSVLAIDMGSSSIRGYLGIRQNGQMRLTEVHRASHQAHVTSDGSVTWDLNHLIAEAVRACEATTRHLGKAPDSVAIDGWGVDYAYVDAGGAVVGPVYAYRDRRGTLGRQILRQTIEENTQFSLTGVAPQDINTCYRLAHMSTQANELPGDTVMFLQDIVARAILTADITGWERGDDPGPWASRGVASTSSLVGIDHGGWVTEIADAVKATNHLPALADELTVIGHRGHTAVVRAGSHDTACAVYSLDMQPQDVFVSCGSWAIVGAVAPPVIDPAVTNEATTDGANRVQVNLTGMWLAQECRRAWEAEGHDVSFSRLDALARQAASPGFTFDPSHPSLSQPGDMPRRINDLLEANGEDRIEDIGQILRLINESVARSIGQAVATIRRLTGADGEVHLMGGGTQDPLLVDLLAQELGKVRVAANEASALGNLLAQLHVLGVQKDETDAWLCSAGIGKTITPTSE
ncbi:MAG: FGGY-family carbohydrate kinase [Actinomycetaceae bacterium]|nr:FGGY-family carbohydrate kinase [Actinomycetaceae bacterium]